MPGTRTSPEEQETTTQEEEKGPFLLLVDTSYDEHWFAGPFGSKDEANAFQAELSARSGGPFEYTIEKLVGKDDLLEVYPEPQPELTATEQAAKDKAEQEKTEKDAAEKAKSAVA
jgi:hypothetical protein